VKNYRGQDVPDWNTYAITAIIELARNEGKNPDVPRWMADDYFHGHSETRGDRYDRNIAG